MVNVINILKKKVQRSIAIQNKPPLIFLVRFLLAIWRIFPDSYILLGITRQDNSVLKVLILGDEKNVHYLSTVLYSKKPHKIKAGKVFLYGILFGKMHFNFLKVDLVFIITSLFWHRLLKKKAYFLLPEWVKFSLNVTNNFENFKKQETLRHDIRKIYKFKYSYEITSDINKFNLFYKEMYFPYISDRYGSFANLIDYDDLKYFFLKGKLLLLKYKNNYISGVVLVTKKEEIWFLSVGLFKGKENSIKEGAISSLYYFAIQWAKDNGYKWIDFGGTRPFFNDGVFRYKKKLNTEIRKQTEAVNQYALKIQNLNRSVRAFLANTPFIIYDKNQCSGMFFIDKDFPVHSEEVEMFYKRYWTPGLRKMYGISFSGFSNSSYEFVKAHNLKNLELLEFSSPWSLKLYAQE